MKKIKLLVLMSCLFFINISFVSASNKINSISIDVVLDEYGNGKITEVWDMNVDSKTEVYKSLSNLGNSSISNFSVSMDETNYTFVKNWDINGSLKDKAYKNGFNKTSDGVELCWGMSTYGHHIYKISYTVSNMIYNTNDAQVMYWKFIDNTNMNPTVKNYNIKISGPNYYEDSLDVFGYGDKGGYAYVSNGSIYLSNSDDGYLSSDEYIVLLTKYDLGTFNTSNSFDKYDSFDEVLSLAKEGSSPYKENKGFSYFISLIPILFNLLIWGSIITAIVKVSSPIKYQKKEIDKNNLNSFRDIPCNKDLLKAYLLCDIYKLNKKKEDLLGAILLKWILDKKITIVKQNKKTLFKDKEITAIQLQNNVSFDNENEKKLYDIMISASGDMLLEEDELKKWCKNNYSKFFKWFDETLESIRNVYVSEGHLIRDEKNKKLYKLDDYLYEEATKLAGLKKYLEEFSRIQEKQPIEVHLWEYYLIYAQVFGMAKEVSKQFKDLYPELLEQQVSGTGSFYTDILWIDNISMTSIKAAGAARTAAQNYSSGGGGFSSGGGGGGSFGGGGGGCR